MKVDELRDLRALLTATLERVSEIQRDAGGMLERLWEAKAALEKYGGW